MSRLVQANSFSFNENNQEFIITGKWRPRELGEVETLANALISAAQSVQGTFYMNVRRLTQLNNIAFLCISNATHRILRANPTVKIEIITASALGWATAKFNHLANQSARVKVREYDKDFYPGQTFLEDGGFIPILRNQTRMTWRHERNLLPAHGMVTGMKVADICCGIGDFAVLLQKEFKPTRLLALDHSRSSLDYARRIASEFGVEGIEYVYGDAAEMLIDDNEFDFITCRHSLQIFNKPELILKELFRICKPGGRVYITNEKNSHCLGEPRSESIQWTYNEVAKLFADFKMDVELGPKSHRYLADAGFRDIKMDCFMVTNLDDDPQQFADIIQSWEAIYVDKMARERGDSEEFLARFRKGFQDHIYAALHPSGYAGWPIWAASGRKPA